MLGRLEDMTRVLLLIAPLLAISACIAGTSSSAGDEMGRIVSSVPDDPRPDARYVFYLHGRIIEEQGIRPTHPEYGTYEYEAILETFRRRGLIVVSEPRPAGTEPGPYAEQVAGQVRRLIASGVPADRITVVGGSKGAVIAMLASTLVRNRDLRFVLIAGCNDWVRENVEIDLYGDVLSIYDVNDRYGETCGPLFEQSTGLGTTDEIMLEVGTGHAILYRPIREWVEPVLAWIESE